MEPVHVVMLGAGGRGFYSYGNWILDHPEQIRVVAVAELSSASLMRSPSAASWRSFSIDDLRLVCMVRRASMSCPISSPERGSMRLSRS